MVKVVIEDRDSERRGQGEKEGCTSHRQNQSECFHDHRQNRKERDRGREMRCMVNE